MVLQGTWVHKPTVSLHYWRSRVPPLLDFMRARGLGSGRLLPPYLAALVGAAGQGVVSLPESRPWHGPSPAKLQPLSRSTIAESPSPIAAKPRGSDLVPTSIQLITWRGPPY